MKVQCDVCEKAQATILCCADDAALCELCDAKVHAANKLAEKHQRIPLIYPSPDEELPRCDICQEKSGHFFCLEDRALLCQSCDFSIHSGNALAAKHKRFLLSGIRVPLHVITTESIKGPCSESKQTSPTITQSQSSSPRVVNSTPKPSKMPVQVPNMKSSGFKTSNPHQHFPSHCKRAAGIDGENHDLPSRVAQPPLKKSNNNMGSFPPNIVPFSPSPTISSTGNQQLYFNSEHSQTDWDILDMIDMQYNGMNPSGASRGGGFVRRSSASEYMNATMPGWKVDELLSFPDMATTRGNAERGSSKADTSTSSGDVDWHIGCNAFEDLIVEEMVAEVPLVPSPPTTSGLPKSTKQWKSFKQSDLDFAQGFDNPLVVPDIGSIFSPPASPNSPPERLKHQ